MRRALAFLLLLSCARPAGAAIQFSGHGANSAGCVSRLDFSSDLGPPWVATRPFADLVNGFDISSDTTIAGFAGAYSRVLVAPAGPVSFATGPVFTFQSNGFATNNGNIYGRFSSSEHRVCLKYLPPGAGSTVHWAMRWRRVRSVTVGATASTFLRTPFAIVLQGSGGADSGMVFGSQVGTSSLLCNFDMAQNWSVGSINAGTASGSFEVEIFLDNAPPPLDVETADTAPERLEMAPSRPNPSRGPSSLEFLLPVGGQVAIDILDVAGRTVRQVAPGVLPAGRHVVQWDGRGADGAQLRAGIYFVRLALAAPGGGERTCGQRIVIVE